MTLVVCWSLWGLVSLSYALYKQVKKRYLASKEAALNQKKNDYELYTIVKETKQNKMDNKYTIPMYEDFAQKDRFRQSIVKLEDYIKGEKEEGWD